MSELLGIYIKTLDDGIFQLSQNVLIQKFLEDTGTDHCNGVSTPTRVEKPPGTGDNDTDSNIY